MNVVSIKQEHKHTAKILKLIYTYLEANFDDFTQSVDFEYDVAVKLLSRMAHHLPRPPRPTYQRRC